MTVMKVLNTGCMFDPPIIGIFVKMKTISRFNLCMMQLLYALHNVIGLNISSMGHQVALILLN